MEMPWKNKAEEYSEHVSWMRFNEALFENGMRSML